jgi:hypothetical protein
MIRGTVIDYDNNPVAGALAWVIGPGPRGTQGSTETNSNGAFRLTDEEDGDYLTIFIQEKEPEGFMNVAYPADVSLRKLPAFRGITSKISEDGWVFLHDVHPTVSYSAVTIDLRKEFNLSEKTIAKNLHTATVSLYNGNLKIRDKVEIMPQYVSGTIAKLAFPKYDWRVVLSISDGRRRRQSIVNLKNGLIAPNIEKRTGLECCREILHDQKNIMGLCVGSTRAGRDDRPGRSPGAGTYTP